MISGRLTLVNLLDDAVNNAKLFTGPIDESEQIGLLVTDCAEADGTVVKDVLGWGGLGDAAVLNMFQLDVLSSNGKWSGLNVGDNPFVGNDEGIITIDMRTNDADQSRGGDGGNK